MIWATGGRILFAEKEKECRQDMPRERNDTLRTMADRRLHIRFTCFVRRVGSCDNSRDDCVFLASYDHA